MREVLHAYNLSHGDVLEHLVSLLNIISRTCSTVRVRCIGVEDGRTWRNALCIIKVWPDGKLPLKEKSRGYRGIKLLEEWIELAQLETTILRQIEKGSLNIDGEDISLDVHTRFNEREYLPSDNDYSTFPGFVFRAPCGERPQISHGEPLLSYSLPFYPNPYFAIREWSEYKIFHDHSDARIGTLQVFIPQCDAYFEKAEMVGRKLQVSVKGIDIPGLMIKGAWEHDGRTQSFEHILAKPAVSIDVPQRLEGFEVYLIGSDGAVYDYHRETKYWFIGQKRILQNISGQAANEQTAIDAIKRGEGESIEFKPYIYIGDPKHDELVRTVIAFANTKGGVALIGVSNHGTIEGIEKEIGKKIVKRQGKLRDGLDKYLRWLKQSIGEKLNRALEIEVSIIEIEGHSVAMMRVPEGPEKPYANVQTKVIYVRHGAHNAHPDPDLEIPQLYKGSQDREYPR